MTTGFYRFGNDPAEVMNGTYLDKARSCDAGVFLFGVCGVFAAALARRFGYGIHMLRDAGDAPGLDSAIHIFCVCTNPETGMEVFIDARGITDNRRDAVSEFEHLYGVPVIERVDLSDLEAWLDSGLGPCRGSYQSYADQLIQEHLDYYNIQEVYEKMEKNYILSRDGKKKGEIKNLSSRRCTMEGCTGVRMHVKWTDGKSTYPCTKGCIQLGPHLWKID